MGKETTKSTKSKSKKGDGAKKEPTAWNIAKTKELKDANPDQSGADRQKEVSEAWKTSEDNPKNQGD
ncbi:hypothetical protein RQP46_009671 [Phenoliferia psychrophenolica]